MRNNPRNLLQIFCEVILDYKVTLKGSIGPDDKRERTSLDMKFLNYSYLIDHDVYVFCTVCILMEQCMKCYTIQFYKIQ